MSHRSKAFTAVGLGLGLVLAASNALAADASVSPEVGRARFIPGPCPLTIGDASQQDELATYKMNPALALAVGTFAAGLAGDVVNAGVSALASAIDNASQAKTFAAEGRASFTSYVLKLPDAGTGTPDIAPIALTPRAMGCLVFVVDGTSGGKASTGQIAVGDVVADPSLKAVAGLRSAPDIKAALTDQVGLTVLPALYVEAELQPRSDGMIVRPLLIWYRQPLTGAPKSALPAELDITFATPSNTSATPSNTSATPSNTSDATDIGTVFALARMPLPPIAVGQALGPGELLGYRSSVVPYRPNTGAVATALTAANSLYTSRSAKATELAPLKATLDTAKAAKSPDPKAIATAQANYDKSNGELTILDKQITDLKTAIGTADKPAMTFGSTNVKFHFIVVRDANAFGQAIAKALTTRGATLGTDVTTALTPKAAQPAFTAADTTYVSSMVTAQAKQQALNAALTAGDPTAIANAKGDLANAQAAANAAAVGANLALPFPNLLNSILTP